MLRLCLCGGEVCECVSHLALLHLPREYVLVPGCFFFWLCGCGRSPCCAVLCCVVLCCAVLCCRPLLQVAVYQVAASNSQAYLVIIGREDLKVAVLRVLPSNVSAATDEWHLWWHRDDAMPQIVNLLNKCVCFSSVGCLACPAQLLGCCCLQGVSVCVCCTDVLGAAGVLGAVLCWQCAMCVVCGGPCPLRV